MRYIGSRDIHVGYGEKIVLDELNIEFPLEKITTIIGPNGCGKSTLLKTLGRILQPNKGSIILEGEDIHTMSTKKIAKKMAILPQSPIPPEGLTVEELVSYGRFPHQSGLKKLRKEDHEIIDWALEVTDLKILRESEVDKLSGGQRQRVWIAMALAQQTDIILLDEPTTYLDMAYQLDILLLLDELNKKHNTTIIMVLHDINLASRFSDYIVALKAGSIISSGKPDDVMTKEVLKNVYDIEANIVTDPITDCKVCLSYNLLNILNHKKKGA